MNPLDALLLILLVPFALRGYWRGFCRESLGLAGIFGGVLAAAAFGPRLADVLVARHLLGPTPALPVAWAAIFVASWIVAGIVGRVAARLARVLFLGGIDRFAGVVFGAAKGAALLGFGLLLVEHFAPSPDVTRVIARSRLGRPLEQIASSVVATGRELGTTSPERRA